MTNQAQPQQQQKTVEILHNKSTGGNNTLTSNMVRVAAYFRVSTDKECQQSSFDTQISPFREKISAHPGWTLADVYVDDGLSGTSTNKRPGFKRMICDCEGGKIDYIITKSISRFARNTIDCLHYVRYLKDLGVYIIFYENNLDTASSSSEMLLSILAAVAQEESHSISENMKWGVRKRFAAGIPKWSPTYGYINRNGEYIINEEQAVGVRRIFELYIEGKSLPQVSEILNQEGIPSMEGGKWWPKTVGEILVNPKYVGDEEMQKTYVVNHITHKKVRNDHSIVLGYRITGHHKGIVDRHTFELAGLILEMKDRHKGCVQYPYRGKLICPVCGSPMICAKTQTNGYPRVWTCGGKLEEDITADGNCNTDESCDNNTDNTKLPATPINAVNTTDTAKCPVYAVKETYIDKALRQSFEKLDWDAVTAQSEKNGSRGRAAKAALQWCECGLDSIEYIMLDELVDTITLKTGSAGICYDGFVIKWKFGVVSTTYVRYERLADIPYIYTEESGINVERHNTCIQNCCGEICNKPDKMRCEA